jgi:hypothetical protein
MELEQLLINSSKHTWKILRKYKWKIGERSYFTTDNVECECAWKLNRVVNFATYKNLITKSTVFPAHWNIHKHILTSPEKIAYSQINHIFLDRKAH